MVSTSSQRAEGPLEVVAGEASPLEACLYPTDSMTEPSGSLLPGWLRSRPCRYLTEVLTEFSGSLFPGRLRRRPWASSRAGGLLSWGCRGGRGCRARAAARAARRLCTSALRAAASPAGTHKVERGHEQYNAWQSHVLFTPGQVTKQGQGPSWSLICALLHLSQTYMFCHDHPTRFCCMRGRTIVPVPPYHQPCPSIKS